MFNIQTNTCTQCPANTRVDNKEKKCVGFGGGARFNTNSNAGQLIAPSGYS